MRGGFGHGQFPIDFETHSNKQQTYGFPFALFLFLFGFGLDDSAFRRG